MQTELITRPYCEPKRITCPVVFVRADQEPRYSYPAERFKENLRRGVRSGDHC